MTGRSAARGRAQAATVAVEPLLAEVGEIAGLRSRPSGSVTRADHLTATALGVAYMAFAAGCAIRVRSLPWHQIVAVSALVAVYALARRTQFVAPTGSTVPTEPVLVALIFVAPLALVPTLVLVGVLLGGGSRGGAGGAWHRLAVRAFSGWHCAGPVLVLWVLAPGPPQMALWPVYMLALASQFAVDAAVAGARCSILRSPLRRLAQPLVFTFAVDALLAPLALCAVVAMPRSSALPLLVALPVALLHVLATDRNQRLNTAVTLGQALISVRDEARSDPMTGLVNRRAWEECVSRAEAERSMPGTGTVHVVLMADLDHLKTVNDNFGHSAGDDLLRAFAAALTTVAPAGAVAARVGGDEFGLLFSVPAADAAAVPALVPALRRAMAATRVGGGISLSASLGTAQCPPCATIGEAITKADDAAVTDKHARHVRRGTVADLTQPLTAAIAQPVGSPPGAC